jgi:hypothetical protein
MEEDEWGNHQIPVGKDEETAKKKKIRFLWGPFLWGNMNRETIRFLWGKIGKPPKKT